MSNNADDVVQSFVGRTFLQFKQQYKTGMCSPVKDRLDSKRQVEVDVPVTPGNLPQRLGVSNLQLKDDGCFIGEKVYAAVHDVFVDIMNGYSGPLLEQLKRAEIACAEQLKEFFLSYLSRRNPKRSGSGNASACVGRYSGPNRQGNFSARSHSLVRQSSSLRLIEDGDAVASTGKANDLLLVTSSRASARQNAEMRRRKLELISLNIDEAQLMTQIIEAYDGFLVSEQCIADCAYVLLESLRQHFSQCTWGGNIENCVSNVLKKTLFVNVQELTRKHGDSAARYTLRQKLRDFQLQIILQLMLITDEDKVAASDVPINQIVGLLRMLSFITDAKFLQQFLDEDVCAMLMDKIPRSLAVIYAELLQPLPPELEPYASLHDNSFLDDSFDTISFAGAGHIDSPKRLALDVVVGNGCTKTARQVRSHRMFNLALDSSHSLRQRAKKTLVAFRRLGAVTPRSKKRQHAAVEKRVLRSSSATKQRTFIGSVADTPAAKQSCVRSKSGSGVSAAPGEDMIDESPEKPFKHAPASRPLAAIARTDVGKGNQLCALMSKAASSMNAAAAGRKVGTLPAQFPAGTIDNRARIIDSIKSPKAEFVRRGSQYFLGNLLTSPSTSQLKGERRPKSASAKSVEKAVRTKRRLILATSAEKRRGTTLALPSASTSISVQNSLFADPETQLPRHCLLRKSSSFVGGAARTMHTSPVKAVRKNLSRTFSSPNFSPPSTTSEGCAVVSRTLDEEDLWSTSADCADVPSLPVHVIANYRRYVNRVRLQKYRGKVDESEVFYAKDKKRPSVMELDKGTRRAPTTGASTSSPNTSTSELTTLKCTVGGKRRLRGAMFCHVANYLLNVRNRNQLKPVRAKLLARSMSASRLESDTPILVKKLRLSSKKRRRVYASLAQKRAAAAESDSRSTGTSPTETLDGTEQKKYPTKRRLSLEMSDHATPTPIAHNDQNGAMPKSSLSSRSGAVSVSNGFHVSLATRRRCASISEGYKPQGHGKDEVDGLCTKRTRRRLSGVADARSDDFGMQSRTMNGRRGFSEERFLNFHVAQPPSFKQPAVSMSLKRKLKPLKFESNLIEQLTTLPMLSKRSPRY